MSFAFLSCQNIFQSDSQIKSELEIVESYLNIDEWKQNQKLSDILEYKLFRARKIKKLLMLKHSIKNMNQIIGFKCTICESVFNKPTALGGHMSKMHPNFKKQIISKQELQDENQFLKFKQFENQVTKICNNIQQESSQQHSNNNKNKYIFKNYSQMEIEY